ncbi:DUF1996 domain-containing protein [Streptomyces sp. NPDC005925]|uniref:DUF1996 domain-containing protein n=1 Tax=Streptomyces sp. NPDC005925 TaxID=3157172 RepID=UPI0033C2635E
MGSITRKRRTPLITRVVAASAALALGGGGLIWANFHASAHESGSRDGRTGSAGARIATIDCPDVGQRLSRLPRGARSGVDRELANLDEQITEAYTRLASTRDAQESDPAYVQNVILGPLTSRRDATIDRIGIAIRRAGGSEPSGLDRFAGCRGVPAEQPETDEDGAGDGPDQNPDGQDGGREQGGGGRQGDNGNGAAGPVAEDFVDITTVEPDVRQPQRGEQASTGSFTTACGVNENDLFNSDNLIAAPGVDNGAHHTHDYVGNQDNDAFSSDEDLANADTSCQNQGDRSTYYWPVLRLQDGGREFDADEQGGGAEGNVGTILQAERAEIVFVGNPRSQVVAMPKLLRIITGDAKAFTNGDANANAGWSCTGFEDRVLADKYPLCPDGSEVVRMFDFQSCWDGRNTDSANHRDHVAFADPATGACPEGFRAIPRLTMNLVYDVPRPTVEDGQVRNPFAVDGFPEQLHKPITDHDDFINVMDEDLMNRVVDCVNSGEDCR